jgi:outer membrane protein assembly factor BamB
VWATHLKGGAFVNVVLDGNTILATTYGEVFCLDALTGGALWHNRLKGYGMGLTSIATVNNPGGSATLTAEEQRRETERRAATA